MPSSQAHSAGALRSRSQGRGQRVSRKLRSTDDFTNKNKLSLDDRKLILFLVVNLLDEEGSLTKTYQAVMNRFGHVEGHWAHGKNLDAMRSCGSKFLGKSATRRPSWRKIDDTVRAACDEREVRTVLAHAAGLYCKAAGVDAPEGYEGEIADPTWASAAVDPVTVDMIISEAVHGPRKPPDTAQQAEHPVSKVRRWRDAALRLLRLLHPGRFQRGA